MSMRLISSKKGFTIIEVMVVSVITAIVIMASSQATLIFLKSMKKSEKMAESSGESQDLTMYLRRSAKNLSIERLRKDTTYRSVPNSTPVLIPANAATVLPALTIDPQKWLEQSQSHPHYDSDLASTATLNIFIDSFNLEEHGLRNNGGDLVKFTRRLVVSRCEALPTGQSDKIFSAADGADKPQVSALYILHSMKRRPFIGYDSAGLPQIRCCPQHTPNCSDGRLPAYYFKAFAISFNNAGAVVGVEEFPKSNTDNPVVGAGFGLYVSGQNATITSFTLVNRCKTSGLSPRPACSVSGIGPVMTAFGTDPSILKIDLRNITTSMSFSIGQTGVISL